MNKRQKLVQQRFLNNEEAVIKRLTTVYNKSLDDITKKSKKLYDEIEELTSIYDDVEDEAEKAVLKSRIQSKVYQKQYQDSLKKQVSDILDKMHNEEFETVADYLQTCYTDGFVGTLYDIQGQGIPLAFPLDQEAMVRAVQLDSKISTGLYKHLGEDVTMLKKHITAQVSRGIASNMTFAQIAQQLSAKMVGQYKNKGGSLYNAMRIARTEGHRIQCQAGMDACYNAKDRGADVVKQWDSTIDAKTRNSHVDVDGQIRELDEKFGNGLMFPGDPSGAAAEVIHCRCALLQRARWAVKGGFTKMNNFTKQLETFDSPEDYAEFKKGFFSKENRQYMNYVQQMEEKYKTKDFQKVLGSMTESEYSHYSKLLGKNPLFNKNTTPAEDIRKAITGKNLVGEIDYQNSLFMHDIETAMHAQGFDGLPKVASNEDFEEALKKSNFYAERTYSAATQEQLDEYRDMLYNGRWYVDCSTGGAQYGQGMYCAARFEEGKYVIPHDNKIGWEMSHYQSIGINSGRPFSYTEGITLEPSAKIFTMYSDVTDITNRYAKEYALKHVKSAEAKETLRELIDIQEQIDIKTSTAFTKKVDWNEVNNLYNARDVFCNSDVYKNECSPLISEAFTKARGINEGALAVEMGYDAINAAGHGESGSYTVILNRTKVIFREGGSRFGN